MHTYEISSNQLSLSKQNSASRHRGHVPLAPTVDSRGVRLLFCLLPSRPLGLRTLTHCLPHEFISVLELGF